MPGSFTYPNKANQGRKPDVNPSRRPNPFSPYFCRICGGCLSVCHAKKEGAICSRYSLLFRGAAKNGMARRVIDNHVCDGTFPQNCLSFTTMASPDASHVAQLSDSLQRLQQEQQQHDHNDNDTSGVEEATRPRNTERSVSVPRSPIPRDGYGFRKSGVSTPLIPGQISDGLPVSQLASELVPDPNGLGWPGV